MTCAVAFRVGDRVESVRGLSVGQRGVIVRLITKPNNAIFAHVKFSRHNRPRVKNVRNLRYIIPVHLRMDKGL